MQDSVLVVLLVLPVMVVLLVLVYCNTKSGPSALPIQSQVHQSPSPHQPATPSLHEATEALKDQQQPPLH